MLLKKSVSLYIVRMDKTYTVYIAAKGYEKQLEQELLHKNQTIVEERERLFLCEGEHIDSFWASNVWLNASFLPIESINDASKKLKNIQRNWILLSTDCHRRANLIAEKLPHISIKPHVFLSPLPQNPLGSWTLWDANTLLFSSTCTSPFPNGDLVFEEDKIQPPNRAYLKLWDVFTLLNIHPEQNELCLELGSAPGGWTWVLASLGAKVFSIDKAPLEKDIDKLPNVHHCIGSGFAITPNILGKVDWLFSDMACYPEKLYPLVTKLIDNDCVENFICTLKCQGENYDEILEKFNAIPNSRIIHLSHNKHELTWINTKRINELTTKHIVPEI